MACEPATSDTKSDSVMQTNSKILDDLARVASGAVGAAFTAREEMQARLRSEFERVLGRLDLVTRDEFDSVRAMAAKAREDQETAAETIAALEARLSALEGGTPKASTRRRPTSKAASKADADTAAASPTEKPTAKKTGAKARDGASTGGAKRSRAQGSKKPSADGAPDQAAGSGSKS